MTLDELERGFEIHEKQMRELRDGQALHEKQMKELRDNQIVQGELLARVEGTLTKASSLLVEIATRINEVAERQAITQTGIESLVKFMDAFKKRLEGGNGHNPA